jgi:hypothetical protein
MPENTETNTENKWYSLMFEDMFRLAAAGSVRRALIISIPTHFMDNITITAIKIQKEASTKSAFMLLLLAREVFRATEFSLLKKKNQYNSVNINTIPNNLISCAEMLNISPSNRLEYLEKFPPFDKNTSPIAMLKEENTEINVSVDSVFLRLI